MAKSAATLARRKEERERALAAVNAELQAQGATPSPAPEEKARNYCQNEKQRWAMYQQSIWGPNGLTPVQWRALVGHFSKRPKPKPKPQSLRPGKAARKRANRLKAEKAAMEAAARTGDVGEGKAVIVRAVNGVGQGGVMVDEEKMRVEMAGMNLDDDEWEPVRDEEEERRERVYSPIPLSPVRD